MNAPGDRPVVVTGGGTAGHVLPAIAVAEALMANGRDRGAIHYIGCERGVETDLIPPTGLTYEFFDVVGLQRSVSKRNLQVIPKLVRATRRALASLKASGAAAVVTVGGYASLPAVLAARRLGIPVVVVSFDHTPGLASRLAARFAVSSAVAFDDSPLPRAIVTGAPVRQEILNVDRQRDRDDARQRLGVPTDRFLVAVVGGSQGSLALNNAVVEYVTTRRDDEERRDLAIYHIAGERFVDTVNVDDREDGLWYRVVGYEPDMAAVYAAADLIVGRGGAGTVHETAVTGTPAVLVPWPGAAEDHQTHNVAWLANVGGAVLLDETDIDQLPGILDDLRGDPERLAAIGEAARSMGERQRSGKLAEVIERAAAPST